MKVLIAIDSFKGSLASIEVSECIEKGIKEVYPDAFITKVPIADGGEGTVDSFLTNLGGIRVPVTVHDPLMRKRVAYYGILPDNTAVIEMAEASGLTLLTKDERNPLETTTYGVGEIILDALNRGCRNFVIGLGGSATNDSGIGMLQALGYRFFDVNHNELFGIAESLNKIQCFIDENVPEELYDCHFEVLCDVKNPLYGINGASFVYAKQKGADESMIIKLDEGLQNFAKVVEEIYGKDYAHHEGAGAAGGLGFAFLAFLNARLVNGIELLINKLDLDKIISYYDIIITGEGKMDSQSLMGKVPYGITRLGKKHNIPVIGLCGGLMDEAYKMHEVGMTALFSIMNYPMNLEEAMDKDKAKFLLISNTREIFRLIKMNSEYKS
ncbi:MAG: glycerate kinase [Bacilli bacterium]|nr:glycerate kinase [Bacilli bacterium]